eukprot:gene41464-51344_t
MCGIYALVVGFYMWRYYIATTVMERLRANKAIDPRDHDHMKLGKLKRYEWVAARRVANKR